MNDREVRKACIDYAKEIVPFNGLSDVYTDEILKVSDKYYKYITQDGAEAQTALNDYYVADVDRIMPRSNTRMNPADYPLGYPVEVKDEIS